MGTARGSEDRRVVVVANRLPASLRRTAEGWRTERSAGGLASALDPVFKRRGGLWVGWPGDAADPQDAERTQLLEEWSVRRGYVPVELSAEELERFYYGYSNRTLWPLLHQFPSRLEFEAADWSGYAAVNRRFRDLTLSVLHPQDLVWVHDYHLMLLPGLLRQASPEAAVAFFLHTPFPPAEGFRVLPHREELLRGLLGADLLAFQTSADLQHFRDTLLRVLGLRTRAEGVEVEGRLVRLEARPIGIAAEEFTARLAEDGVRARVQELRRRGEGRRLLLAVDRLDYTKGIPQRLRAYRRLFELDPDLRGRVELVQVAVPSRERIPGYARLSREVNELVGAINGELGTPEWTPVRYVRRSVVRQELLALYSAADVAWVAPLRDGMNLVAKEYVACQAAGDGVLVLSEFAGASSLMPEALLVNPYDEDATARTVQRALAMDAPERRRRMSALRERVLAHGVAGWSERMLESLQSASATRRPAPHEAPRPLPMAGAVDAFRAAERRLVLLDYDGTLVPLAELPAQAVPPPALVGLLRHLASFPQHAVAVVSGRPPEELEVWFGDVEGLWLAAEHGAVLRHPRTARWERLYDRLPQEWKARVRPLLERYTEHAPGSLVEEKSYSLVWHYRACTPVIGEWLAVEVAAALEDLLDGTDLRVVRGSKSIEVRLRGVGKGGVVSRIESHWGPADFRMALGDDLTDEDLFERLPAPAWTIRVGHGRSQARFRLNSPAAVADFLERLAASHEAAPAEAVAPSPGRLTNTPTPPQP